MKTIKDFFHDYAILSLNANSQKISACYDDSFIAASKNQSASFKNDQNFIEWLNQVFEFNKATGLKALRVNDLHSSPLGKYFLKATVTWAVQFNKKPTEEILFDIHYILKITDQEYKIVLYISEDDQEELMKEKGLL